MNIVLENVLETMPDLIVDIMEGVNDPRFRMCFDVGHINAYSYVPILDWLEKCAPWVGHIHINNNNGKEDGHNGLYEGSPVPDRCPVPGCHRFPGNDRG